MHVLLKVNALKSFYQIDLIRDEIMDNKSLRYFSIIVVL